jgi:hypothetical protein
MKKTLIYVKGGGPFQFVDTVPDLIEDVVNYGTWNFPDEISEFPTFTPGQLADALTWARKNSRFREPSG